MPLESGVLLDMIVTVWSGEHEASVRISHSHTHIVSIRVDGNTLFSEDGSVESTEATVDYALLTVEDICAFADCLDPDDVSDVLDRQIECNTAIAAEGLKSGMGRGYRQRAAGYLRQRCARARPRAGRRRQRRAHERL